jgi:hypothetical protein
MAYKDKPGKYLVVYDTKYGGRGVINVFKSKAKANKQVSLARKSESFKKLGYSRPRVILNK